MSNRMIVTISVILITVVAAALAVAAGFMFLTPGTSTTYTVPVGALSPTTAAGPASAPAAPPATATTTSVARWRPPSFAAHRGQRDRMVTTIRQYGLTDKAVLAAMAAVPRHEFVPAAYQDRAYADSPLPIGHGQTISQPYIVAEMTRRLRLAKDDTVLEIGTGSGYQAAVLTHFTPNVYTIEIVKPLAMSAGERLRRLGYTTVRTRHADGYDGWARRAPFNAIIVTAAAGQIPPPLLKQLAPGGRMIIPVGKAYGTQSLILVEKDAEGQIRSRNLMPVRFVPFVRRAAD